MRAKEEGGLPAAALVTVEETRTRQGLQTETRTHDSNTAQIDLGPTLSRDGPKYHGGTVSGQGA